MFLEQVEDNETKYRGLGLTFERIKTIKRRRTCTFVLIAVVFELFVFDIPPLLNWRQRLYFVYLFHRLNIILVPT